MAKYSSIAVIYGSDTSEWEVACRSGEFTAASLDQNVYDVYEILARFGKWQLVACRKKNSMRITFPEGSRPEIDKTDFSVRLLGEKVKFDFVFIMQHGSPGENGLMQGYFEMLGIPFSSCGSLSSTIAFDKYACKCYLREQGRVKMAPDSFIREGADIDAFCSAVVEKLRFPLFVKPTQGGSSFGVTRVTSAEELSSAIRFAFSESPTVIVEQGVSGRELTCAAYNDGAGIATLPLIEIVTDNEYFDYDAKYNGHSSEICPAPICDSLREEIEKTTADLYAILGCKGLVRMDYISCEDGLYFLEVNTIPGMTSASLVPRMVRTAGMDMGKFLDVIIENS